MARKVKKVYVGVNGIARQVWSSYGFDTLTKMANPAILPTGSVLCTEYSPDGNYLAVGHDESPYLTVYKIEGNVYTKLPNVYNAVKYNVKSVSWHPNGQRIACSVATSQGATDVILTIESGSVSLFKALSGSTGSISYHPNGLVLVTGNGTYLRLYNAETGSYIGNIMPSHYRVGQVRFSPDGLTLYAEAVSYSSEDPNEYRMIAFSIAGSGERTSNYSVIWMSGYSWDTSNWNTASISVSDSSVYVANVVRNGYVEIGKNRARITTLPTGIAKDLGAGLAFSAGGEYLIVVGMVNPYVKMYKRVGDAFTEVALGVSFSGSQSVAVNQLQAQIAIGLYNSPFLGIYIGN